jgi:hypothetical protein
MTRHIDAMVLARLREGDLSQRKAARVSAHLARCARCAELGSELAGVTVLLASAAAPPIPEYLDARIRTTLAAESARRAAADAGTEPGRRDLPARSHRARRGPRVPRASSPAVLRTLAAAGAVAVLAGGGIALVHQLGGGPAHGTAGNASSGVVAGPGPKSAPRAAGSAAEPDLRTPAFGPSLRYGSPGHQASFVPVSTATDFSPASLDVQVSAALSQVKGTHAGTFGGSGTPAGRSSPARSPSAGSRFGGIPLPELQACVTRVAAGHEVLLVDLARYQGRPATIIVTAPASPAARQVWVVGQGCSGSRSDVLAHRPVPGG